jgi:hypothetical protein
MCKLCHNAYTREHYKNNKKYYLNKARKNERKYKIKARELIWNYLLEHPCIDCGEIDPIVLEFDHIDSETKEFTLGAIGHGMALKRIKEEIEKCEVRCANCHRRKTAKQFNWWRHALVYPVATNDLKG